MWSEDAYDEFAIGFQNARRDPIWLYAFFKDQNSVGTIMKSENSLLMRNVEQDMEMLLPTLSQGERLIRVVLVVGFVVVLAIEAWLLFQVLQS